MSSLEQAYAAVEQAYAAADFHTALERAEALLPTSRLSATINCCRGCSC